MLLKDKGENVTLQWRNLADLIQVIKINITSMRKSSIICFLIYGKNITTSVGFYKS